MAKELYLYSPIYDFVAESLMAQIDERMGEEAVIRSNTPGGSVFANYGICAKIQEHGNVTIKVDGNASSSGANMLFYAKRVECLDVTTFVLHRADMFISTPEDQAFLDKINKDLKSKMLARVDKEVFKEVTGYTIEQMFDPEKRIDIKLDAKQAKKIGLVQKINKLSPQEIEAFNSRFFDIAATTQNENTNPKTIKTMTLAELKASHPAVFAEAVQIGLAQGADQERERINAWAHFMDVDAKSVKEGIASGKAITQAQTFELMEKKFSAKAVSDLEKDSEGKPLATNEPANSASPEAKKAKELEAFKQSVLANSEVLFAAAEKK
jgi:ATP-dependent protease ClpP protease subunit